MFPVIVEIISGGNTKLNLPGLIKWNIQNKNNEPVSLSIISEIPEWTQPVISTVELNPGETKAITQTPFGNKLLSNNTIVPATVILNVKNGENVIFEETRNLNIRAVDDMIWSLISQYDMAALIAAWVTPNDPLVEQILSYAKGSMPNNQFSDGYNNANVRKEVKAIFNAVRKSGISYVNSTLSFGIRDAQRVRLPKESINEKSANCIDGSVLFASLFENIGLEPLIILVQGHAFIGVRMAPNSNEILFIETTIVGRSVWTSIYQLTPTFDSAVKEGGNRYDKEMRNNPNAVRIIDIKKLRALGIYPLK